LILEGIVILLLHLLKRNTTISCPHRDNTYTMQQQSATRQERSKQQKLGFDVYFGLLKKVGEKKGNVNVPIKYTTKSGICLGVWLKNTHAAYHQKMLGSKMNKRLTDEQIKALEDLGVEWNFTPPSKSTKEYGGTQDKKANTEPFAFMEGFMLLANFKCTYEHCSVPVNHSPLYEWCEEVRAMVEKQRLPIKQVNMLKAIGFQLITFEELVEQLSELIATNGHCRIPREHQCYTICKGIRELKLDGRLNYQEEVVLNAIGFDWTTTAKCTITSREESEKDCVHVRANEMSPVMFHNADSYSLNSDGSGSITKAGSIGNREDDCHIDLNESIESGDNGSNVSVASGKENNPTSGKVRIRPAAFKLSDSEDSDDTSTEPPPRWLL